MDKYIITLKEPVCIKQLAGIETRLVTDLFTTDEEPIISNGCLWLRKDQFIPLSNILGFVKIDNQNQQ